LGTGNCLNIEIGFCSQGATCGAALLGGVGQVLVELFRIYTLFIGKDLLPSFVESSWGDVLDIAISVELLADVEESIVCAQLTSPNPR